MIVRRPATDTSAAGFTLAEVMVASTVLAAGITVGLMGISAAESARARAGIRQDALVVARAVNDRLVPLTSSTCPGAPGDAGDLLADIHNSGSIREGLACLGNDTSGTLGACEPDYPRPGFGTDDLVRALGDDAPGLDQLFRITGNNSVRYNRTEFRVVWNVACDAPVLGSKMVQVIVAWSPYGTAMDDGNFEKTSFVKGSGF